MSRWVATLDTGQRMNMGGMTASFQEQTSVSADSEQEARKLAREAKPGMKIVRIEKVWAFHITLRGKTDKRKRETFIVKATNERDAIRYLSSNSSAVRFGYGFSKKARAESIVKIERKELS